MGAELDRLRKVGERDREALAEARELLAVVEATFTDTRQGELQQFVLRRVGAFLKRTEPTDD